MRVQREERDWAQHGASAAIWGSGVQRHKTGHVTTPYGIVAVTIYEPTDWLKAGLTVYRFAYNGRAFSLREETMRTPTGAATIAHRWVKRIIDDCAQ
jgi:hypothetical protein